MVVPFAANISYVDSSVRPLTHVRGTKDSIFVTRSVTKRRLVLGPSLLAASSVGTPYFPTGNCTAVYILTVEGTVIPTVVPRCWRLRSSALSAFRLGSRCLPYRGSSERLHELCHLAVEFSQLPTQLVLLRAPGSGRDLRYVLLDPVRVRAEGCGFRHRIVVCRDSQLIQRDVQRARDCPDCLR